MLELFKIEVENHCRIIENGLVEVESSSSSEKIEPLMRAAHSIKGAARIVGLDIAVTLAHAMEDVLSAAQHNKLTILPEHIDVLLKGNDLFQHIVDIEVNQIPDYLDSIIGEVEEISSLLKDILAGKSVSVQQKADKQITQKAELDAPVEEKNVTFRSTPEPPKEIDNQAIIKKQISTITQLDAIDIADTSMLELFKIEVENHCRIIENGLVEVESSSSSEKIEPLMRAAHSIKGAARIVGLDIAVTLAHAMEDVLSAAQHNKLTILPEHIDVLLKGNDLFQHIVDIEVNQIPVYLDSIIGEVEEISSLLKDILAGKSVSVQPKAEKQIIQKVEIDGPVEEKNVTFRSTPEPPKEFDNQAITKKQISSITQLDANEKSELKPIEKREKTVAEFKDTTLAKEPPKTEETFVRVLSSNLNKLMGLAGESLVQARSVKPFSVSLLNIKDLLLELNSIQEYIFTKFVFSSDNKEFKEKFGDLNEALDSTRDLLNKHLENYEKFSRRMENVTERLYNEALSTRMKPFSEGLHGFRRMVRDLAKNLGKNVEFEVLGAQTKVDRDILEKLESPLTHLLRNAIDHGIELPEDRIKSGKSPDGKLTLEARHRSGMLIISIQDDGKGIDPEYLRTKIVERGYTSAEMAADLTTIELMEFLFLPGFSTASKVTEISGREIGRAHV